MQKMLQKILKKIQHLAFTDKVKTYSFEEYDSPLLYPRISYIVNLIEDVKYIMDINIVQDSIYSWEVPWTLHSVYVYCIIVELAMG